MRRLAASEQGRWTMACGASPERTVGFWMSAPVVTVRRSASLGAALLLMRSSHVRCLPVVTDSHRLCGMLTYDDLRDVEVLHGAELEILAVAAALRRTPVAAVMTNAPVMAGPETDIGAAGVLLVERGIEALPIVDIDDQVIGIITQSDLLNALLYDYRRATSASGETARASSCGEIAGLIPELLGDPSVLTLERDGASVDRLPV